MTKRVVGFQTATSLVVASMIGTGVFTSLGFQLLGVHSAVAILLLWIIGGVIALCGALAYGELGAAMPRSGGEYRYLSDIFHPAVGFLSGWVSATVAFAAPIALAAMAMGDYTNRVFTSIHPKIVATAAIILFTVVHAASGRMGSRFQDISTGLKLLVIVVFIAAGFIVGPTDGHRMQLYPDSGTVWDEVMSGSFATSLFFIFYAYSGWNTSSYIAGEISEPQRNLPRSLLWGTLGVTALYVLLNFVFLYTTPIAEMSGKVDVGLIAAQKIFGETGGKFMGLMIALILVSSVSSFIMAGPRVAQAMGQDIPLLRPFAWTTSAGVPAFAIVAQSAIALILIFTATFQDVTTYIGFTLNIFTLMTVAGLIVLRIKRPGLPRPYRTWGYPVTPILFLILGLWPVIYALKDPDMKKPSLYGLATVLTGLIVYALGGHRQSAEAKQKNQ